MATPTPNGNGENGNNGSYVDPATHMQEFHKRIDSAVALFVQDRMTTLKPKDFIPDLSPADVQEACIAFLRREPGWLTNAISRDPALSKKLETPEVMENPALFAETMEEIGRELMLYQGLHAIALHRQAHALYEQGKADPKKALQARQLSQAARHVTGGIEIHPGAQIGENFFIDHGAGCVIGETAVIGDNVMLYHRITLGSDGKDMPAGKRRHPQIGDNVTICTGAEILGASTIENSAFIGAGAKIIGPVTIGAKATIAPQLVIRRNVPAGANIVGTTQNGDLVYSTAKNRELDLEPTAEEKDFHLRIRRNVPAGANIVGTTQNGDLVYSTAKNRELELEPTTEEKAFHSKMVERYGHGKWQQALGSQASGDGAQAQLQIPG